jgi:hypothetical protein
MQLTVQIPDDLAQRLINATCGDLSRRALEAGAADEYRNGQINKPDLRRLLGLETGYEIGGFLKAHDVYEDCAVQDIEDEVAALIRLGV